MNRGLLGLYLIVATLTLGYGSVFTLLAEIRARFGLDDWAIGVIGAAGFAAGFSSQLFLSRFADRGHLRTLICGGLIAAMLGFVGMIAAERSEMLCLRDADVISDGVMRRIQQDLDLEQVLLESSQSALTGLEKPDEGNT